MTEDELVRRLETIRVVGVVNWRHDGETISEAIGIIRKYYALKLASDANLKDADRPGHPDESAPDE